MQEARGRRHEEFAYRAEARSIAAGAEAMASTRRLACPGGSRRRETGNYLKARVVIYACWQQLLFAGTLKRRWRRAPCSSAWCGRTGAYYHFARLPKANRLPLTLPLPTPETDLRSKSTRHRCGSEEADNAPRLGIEVQPFGEKPD